MLRRLFHPVPMLAVWLTACSPAEPPLLVDGNREPANTITQAPTSGETLHNSSGNVALRR